MVHRLGGQGARTVLVLIGVGVLLGLLFALRTPFPGPPEPSPEPPGEASSSFAAYFVHIFPGRTADGSRPGRSTPLLRATKFLAGERVGLRVQTAPAQEEWFQVELRFLSADTREEKPELRDDRQRFRIRPGLRTYCCLRLPREPGRYEIGILVDGAYLTYLPANVEKPLLRSEGGLFGTP